MAPEISVETPSTAGTPATPVTPKKSGTGKIVLGIIVLAVVYFIYKSSAGATPKTPDEVVARMMSSMGSVKTAEYAGALKANLKGTASPLDSFENLGKPSSETKTDAEKNVEFTAGFEGFLDATEVEKPKSDLTISLSGSDFPADQSAEIQVVTTEGNKYFKLNKVPMLGKLNLASLTNIWVNLDTKALQEQFAPATSTADDATTKPFTEDQRSKVRNIIAGAHIVQVTEDKGDEDLDGIATYHYMFSVNESEFMRAAREIHQVSTGKALTMDEEKKMSDFWANAEVQNGQLWIGKSDFRLYHVSCDLMSTKLSDNDSSGVFNVDMQMRNFNNPVTVAAPEHSSSMVDFMGQVIGIMLGQSMGSAMMGRGR